MEAVVNVTSNWGIGLNNRLLVCISEDLRRFRALTMGKTVILGRKTLETFPGGRPLKNRTNIVLTTNRDFSVEGAKAVHSTEELLELLRGLPREDLSVIGGASVYKQLLPYCDAARVTKTLLDTPADAFFPDLDQLPNWQVKETSEVREENGLRFQYIDYVNLSPLRL